MEAHDIIKYPVSTEKSLRLMEAENKLVFVVENRAKKPQIKKAVEEVFNTKVAQVNTERSVKGTKRAYVKFTPDVSAIDIATNLGLM